MYSTEKDAREFCIFTDDMSFSALRKVFSEWRADKKCTTSELRGRGSWTLEALSWEKRF